MGYRDEWGKVKASMRGGWRCVKEEEEEDEDEDDDSGGKAFLFPRS